MKKTRKEWLSEETYRKIEERRKAKQILNDARTRQGKREANRYYNEKNREVKKSCRRDKTNLIESIAREAEDAAKKNDPRTLYMTTRKLSGIRCNQNRPIRSEDGTLLTKMEDQLQRWKRHFESVLNRPAPSQAPIPDLQTLPWTSTQPSLNWKMPKLQGWITSLLKHWRREVLVLWKHCIEF